MLRNWKAVKCKKKNGKVFVALYQGYIGNKESRAHLVWDGNEQYVINEKEGETFEDASEEESETIHRKVEYQFEYMLTHPRLVTNENRKSKNKPIKLKPKLKLEFEVTEVEAHKPKVLSDFELLTADVEVI